MEENSVFETEELAETLSEEEVEANKKKSRNWNIFITAATGVGVYLFGALGALVGALGGFLSKLIWTKTKMNVVVKVLLVAVVWIVLICFYIFVGLIVASL